MTGRWHKRRSDLATMAMTAAKVKAESSRGGSDPCAAKHNEISRPIWDRLWVLTFTFGLALFSVAAWCLRDYASVAKDVSETKEKIATVATSVETSRVGYEREARVTNDRLGSIEKSLREVDQNVGKLMGMVGGGSGGHSKLPQPQQVQVPPGWPLRSMQDGRIDQRVFGANSTN